MDVDHARFPTDAVKIIQEVADSHFIAFDLEFSGVAEHRRLGGKLTLQQLYEDVKEAARSYQILQVGLTIVKQDTQNGRYVARPYNFNINPIPSLRERYFNRIWSFQSGAVAFLLRNGFQFDLPYTRGVAYLSHTEEELARDAWIREDERRSELPNMENKVEDLPLINHIRNSIQKWQVQTKADQTEYINIPSEAESPKDGVPLTLNRYQVRLTHQTVRNEFPGLKTTGMGHFVQITNPTEEQQASVRATQARYREKELAKAVGFRWLIDAIIGRDINRIPDDYLLSVLSNGVKPREGVSPLKGFLDDLQAKLRTRRRILVGHNCFTDLINFYTCFIGEPPDKVEDFQHLVHELFPAVVDTKYLASFGKKWHSTALEDVEQDLRTQTTPRIEVPAEFDRYVYSESFHEAGYDSLLTAKVAIKLSAKLMKDEALKAEDREADESRPFGIGEEHDEYVTATESPTDHESGPDATTATISDALRTPLTAVRTFFKAGSANEVQRSVVKGLSLETDSHQPSPLPEVAAVLAVRQKPSDRSKAQEVKKIKTTFSSSNIFEVLQRGSSSGDSTNVDQTKDLLSFSSDDEQRTSGDKPKSTLQSVVGKKKLANTAKKGEMMPEWDDEFWRFFGNRLQVNGSQERVWRLAGGSTQTT